MAKRRVAEQQAEPWVDPTVLAQLPVAAEAALALAAGLLTGHLLGRLAERAIEPLSSRAWSFLARRAVFWGCAAAGVAYGMQTFGVDLGVLVGAAGVATVAVGFAAQTSMSNLISGLFLMLERSISVGDVIELGGTTGEIISIDLLSVKLRTFENLMVRIPNEALVKGMMTNLSRFPIRRVDFALRFSAEQPLGPVEAALLSVTEEEPLVLQEPAPQVMLQGFSEGTVDVQLSCWVTCEAYIGVRTRMTLLVLEALQRHGLQLAAPRRELVTLSREAAPRPSTGG
jgi:small-conductance mechanosensitive channel